MNYLKIFLTASVLISMLLYPQTTMQTAGRTLTSWWNNVLPSLLPFFICAEIFSRLGLLQALSIWLTPVMQPLFRLPGAAALGLTLGFFSGSPTGGTIAGDLRQRGLISKNEGDRLLAFTNNAGPLYIMLTVSSTLGAPEVGLWLALSHYPINLLCGLLLRFFADKPAVSTGRPNIVCLLREGWQSISHAPRQPLGVLLRDSSFKALQNIGMIGAFMLIFSLLLHALRQSGLLRLLQHCLTPFCTLLGLPESILPALSEGFFEMTLGVVALGESAAPLADRLLAAAVILSWGGLSVHAQISGVIAGSDLSLRYYLPCRVLHSLAAPLLLLFLQKHTRMDIPAFAAVTSADWLLRPGILLLSWGISMLLLLTVSLGVAALSSRHIISGRH